MTTTPVLPSNVINHAGAVRSTTLLSEYGCARCSVKFPTKSHLIRHMSVIHNLLQYIAERQKFSYECPTCGVESSGLSNLTRHLQVHQQSTFDCTKCPKSYTSDCSLRQHLLRKHGISSIHKKYKCEECDGVFTNRRALTYHSVRHKPPQFCCSQCDHQFFDWAGLLRHTVLTHLGEKRRKSHAKTEFSCERCLLKFPTAKALKSHLYHIHEPKKHKCSNCYMEFAYAHQLKDHLLKTHSLYVESKCQVCHKVFKDQGGLATHSLFHGDPKHLCTQCPLKFYSPHHLSGHVKLMHSVRFVMPEKTNGKEISYFCAVCCRPSDSKRALSQHLQLHYYKPQVCPICQHMSNTDETHMVHMRTKHPDSRDMFHCDVCSKRFPSRDGYLMHMKYHKKPTLACPHCPLLFYVKRAMQAHSNTHNSQTNNIFCDKGGRFGCAICSRKFPSRYRLRGHLTAHNPLTFSCSKCDFLCYNKDTIIRHLQNFH